MTYPTNCRQFHVVHASLKTAILAFVLVATGATSFAEVAPDDKNARVRTTSPSGNLAIEFILAEGTPGYKVLLKKGKDWTEIMGWAGIGIERADAGFSWNTRFVSSSRREVEDSYTLKRGKARVVSAKANESAVELVGRDGEPWTLEFRAYDDGVAFRIHFKKAKAKHLTVLADKTEFKFAPSTRAFMSPANPAYEAEWLVDQPVGRPSPRGSGWGFPALFETDDVWILLTEAGLDRNFMGTRLRAAGHEGKYEIGLTEMWEGNGQGSPVASSRAPWALPWRVLIIGRDLATVVESSLVTTLSEPSKLKDTDWIKPGRVAWSWWSKPSSPQHYDEMLPFIDMSAAMGWEYTLVDANWNTMQGGDWRKLARYAKSKNVRLMLWYNSGGENNRVTEAPRDRLVKTSQRRAEFKRIAAAGIAGIKVDFFETDRQFLIQRYLDILKDAADFHLLVNFHGCTIPRGWSRTYPNLMSHEAVMGAEVYQFNAGFPKLAPRHNATLPFTRNVIGPMDYTPVTFSNQRYPHITTYGHELALSVVFESGLQHFADSVESYASLPQAPKRFLMEIPTVWDETRLVSGTPGEDVVMARRHGKRWYVGGINGEDRVKTFKVDLGFAKGLGTKLKVAVISDGADAKSFGGEAKEYDCRDHATIKTLPFGGFVMTVDAAP